MYILLNENGYVESYALVGNLVDGIEVPDPENTESEDVPDKKEGPKC